MSIAALLLIAAAQTPTLAVPPEVKIVEEEGALVLRSYAGGTALYIFDRDEQGRSNCYESCASNWPPLEAPANARATGKWTVITRTDGVRQWAFEGKPVYRFIHDEEGKAVGDGAEGVWHALPRFPVK